MWILEREVTWMKAGFFPCVQEKFYTVIKLRRFAYFSDGKSNEGMRVDPGELHKVIWFWYLQLDLGKEWE